MGIRVDIKERKIGTHVWKFRCVDSKERDKGKKSSKRRKK